MNSDFLAKQDITLVVCLPGNIAMIFLDDDDNDNFYNYFLHIQSFVIYFNVDINILQYLPRT